MLLGIDEAGRGPVIGDLVISGVLIKSAEVGKELLNAGVRDSKELSKGKRELLFPLIERVSSGISTRIISAEKVDSWRNGGQSLNELEGKVFAQIIDEMSPDKVIVDCSDIMPDKFRKRIGRHLKLRQSREIVCEHFADKNYPVVSAASIIAKVIRDRRIGNLCANFGDLGSGYCHDKRTLSFLENWYDMKGGFPTFVRKTWYTACRIRDEKMQRKLPLSPASITSTDR